MPSNLIIVDRLQRVSRILLQSLVDGVPTVFLMLAVVLLLLVTLFRFVSSTLYIQFNRISLEKSKCSAQHP